MPPFTFEEAIEPQGFSFEEATGGTAVLEADDPLTGELGLFENPDGTTSSEVSFTEKFGDRFFNFPSLVKGQIDPEGIAAGRKATDEQLKIAMDRFKERGGLDLPGFASSDEAIEAAKGRSDAGGSTQKFSQPFSFEEATGAQEQPELGFDAFVEELKAVDPSLAAVVGTGEVALQMGTGFAGALPATILGVSRAIIEGDAQAFPERFAEIQEGLTFDPRTEKGKEFSDNVGRVLQSYSDFVDRTLVEPSLKPGQEDPLTAVIGKTSGEAVALLAPFLLGRRGGVKPDATLDFEAKAPEVRIEPEIPPETPADILRAVQEDTAIRRKAALETPDVPIGELRAPKVEVAPDSTIKDIPIPPTEPRPIATDPALQDPALAFRGERVAEPRTREPFSFEEATEPLPRVVEPEPKAITRGQTPAQAKARAKILQIDAQTDSLMPAIAKMGGLNKAEMVKEFGLDPKSPIQSGVFGKPVLRKKGGKSIEEMQEALAEENFFKRDEVTDQLDPRDFEEKFFEEDAGNKQFSARQDVESIIDFNAEFENYVNSESYKLNVGIPVEEIAAGVRNAFNSLKDSLGIAEKGIQITKPEVARQPGILNPFRSPRMVAKKFPSFAPIKKLADRAMVEQDTLRSIFNKRLNHVNDLLKKGPANFKVNKRHLDNILLQGDMLGKNFTKAELKASGVPENVRSAYTSLRSAYDRALNIANKTKDERGQTRVPRRTGYVPHFFHDWLIVVDKQPVATARTMQEAVKMGNEASRAGGAVKIVPKQFEFAGEDMQAAVVGDLDYFKVQKNLEETFSMTPQEAGDLLSNFARMKGRTRFVGNFLERMGVEGWEKDLAYVHRHYFNMVSRFSALDKFKSKSITAFERQHGDFAKDHSGIAEFTKNYINDINGNPTGIENLLNATLANSPGFSRFLGKHLGSRPSLQIASNINGAVAIAKLGLFNVSSAAVNASQLMMSNALLGPKWTIDGLKRATKIAGSKGLEKFRKKVKANPDVGILKKLGIGLQQGLESGAGYSKFNQMGQLFNKSTALFQGAEWMLRASTGLGAYYKGLSEGMTRPQAIEFAKETNIKANFDYSIADSPSFIRRSGPPGQVLFQFKKFPVKALEFMTELKGSENPRFWIPLIAVSGFYGLPGMEALKNMILRLSGKDIELEAKEFLIRWAGDDPVKKATAKSIMFGAFSNDELGGVDLSRRIGAGDFIPSSGRDLLGPFLSSAITATQLASDEEWLDSLRAITTAPGNLAVALRNDGEISSPWDRGRLTTKLDTKGQVLKGLGFTTTQESVERDLSRIFRKNLREAKEADQKAIDKFIKVMDSGDKEKIEEAIEKLAELGVTSQRIKNEIGKKGLTKSFRTFLNLPKKLQAENIDLLGFAEQEKNSIQ